METVQATTASRSITNTIFSDFLPLLRKPVRYTSFYFEYLEFFEIIGTLKVTEIKKIFRTPPSNTPY